MVSRYLLPVGTLCVALPVILVLVPRLLIPVPTPDSIGDYRDWQPTPAEIRKAVGVGRDGQTSDDRHKLFARMFQQRFRNKQKAVGIGFGPHGVLRAKFAATIPRWDMASVALDLRQEASEVFGRRYKVDIFETYISIAPVKLAELRDKRDPSGVDVLFDPKFAREQQVPDVTAGELMREVFTSRAVEPISVPNPMGWTIQARLEARRAFMMHPGLPRMGPAPLSVVVAR